MFDADTTDSDVETKGADLEATAGSERVAPQGMKALAIVTGLLVVVGGLAGWIGYEAVQAEKAQRLEREYLAVGRQVALNLTSFDSNDVDGDIARLLDQSTGKFHDQFQQQSSAFAEVFQKVPTTTVGSVADAGIESVEGDAANVLVAVTVTTTYSGNHPDPDPVPRGWRLRVKLQQTDAGMKVSDVQFVP
jgi:Mce-associated membrane protein